VFTDSKIDEKLSKNTAIFVLSIPPADRRKLSTSIDVCLKAKDCNIVGIGNTPHPTAIYKRTHTPH